DWISAVVGRAAKRVKRGQAPCRIDLEDGALKVRSAQRRRTVEITVAPLHQRRERSASLAAIASERLRDCNATRRSDSKHRSLEVRAARGGRAIEITVTALHQPGEWDGTVSRRTAKRVKRGQAPCCIDLEHRSLKVRSA